MSKINDKNYSDNDILRKKNVVDINLLKMIDNEIQKDKKTYD